MIKKINTAWMCFCLVMAASPAIAWSGSEIWDGYLDYAYVYSSADSKTLSQRLSSYGEDAGSTLDQYIMESFETAPDTANPLLDPQAQRKAVAYFLEYLAKRDPAALDTSVETIRTLEGRLDRHESRYWYHYILAHQALEQGVAGDFVDHVLSLWRGVVVPLETPYETLRALDLDQAPNAGFSSALPYVYENVARLILIRSQEMGMDEGLDPLTPVVRLLHEGRVGGYPEVIPAGASSKQYMERVVQRLDGPESDGGSLNFTLVLFEASKAHDQARGLLATEGLSQETVQAMRLTTRAYATAYSRAYTLQGHCAVYTRGLRQLGEIYAAKQRLGVDPEIEMPVSIDGAIHTYGLLHEAQSGRWERVGYASTGRQSYVDAMDGLWEEIQESILNGADYHLALSQTAQGDADEHSRNAARLYGRYLSFFLTYANGENTEGVPESAYFAAHEAAKGIGDAFLFYASRPSGEEIDLAVQRYRGAMSLFPFDRAVWSSLATALERQGRESDYMMLVRTSAEAISRSRSVNRWIESEEPAADRIAALRSAFSDSRALLYLGFGEGIGIEELESSLADLRDEQNRTRERVALLTRQLEQQWNAVPASLGGDTSSYTNLQGGLDVVERKELKRQVAEDTAQVSRLEHVIAVRSEVLPVYRETLKSDGLAAEMRSRRDHPVHSLLRRMYYEIRG